MDAGKLSKEHAQAYKGASIIHRGQGNRFQFIYANIIDKNGNILVSADLDYCMDRMKDVSQYF
jgi:hypothetical protein